MLCFLFNTAAVDKAMPASFAEFKPATALDGGGNGNMRPL
jgi:hypothetical protein